MIVIPLDDTGERHLMDLEALAEWSHFGAATIRKHCKPVKKDPRTGKLFYAAEDCAKHLNDANVLSRSKEGSDGVKRLHRPRVRRKKGVSLTNTI